MTDIRDCMVLTGYIVRKASIDIERAFLYRIVPILSRLNVDYDIEVETNDYKTAERYAEPSYFDSFFIHKEAIRPPPLTAYKLIILIKQQRLEYPKIYVPYTVTGNPDYRYSRIERGSLSIRGELILDVPENSVVIDLDASERLQPLEIRE